MSTTLGQQLTRYERDQVAKIATWKAEHPNPFAELFRRAAQPIADLVECMVPDRLALSVLERSYRAARISSKPGDILKKAGIREIRELRDKPLEFCDQLSRDVGAAAQRLATLEGAATGAGGIFTTLLDVPLMFTLCVRTIIRTGYCYGYSLDEPDDQAWVLGAVAVALSSTKQKKVDRMLRLREMEDLLLEDVQEQVVIEEMASLLTQIEIMGDVPGFGAASGALLNWSIAKRVDRTATCLFQERWLNDNGKVSEVAPATRMGKVPAHHGWSGALARAGYHTVYGLSYGACLPVFVAAAMMSEVSRSISPSQPRGRRLVDPA